MDMDFSVLMYSLNPYVFGSALLLTLLTAVFFLGKRGRNQMHGFFLGISNHFNFRSYWLTRIVKFVYALVFYSSVCSGILALINRQALMALVMIVGVPVIARLFLEVVMMLLSIREESALTNDYLLELIRLQRQAGKEKES